MPVQPQSWHPHRCPTTVLTEEEDEGGGRLAEQRGMRLPVCRFGEKRKTKMKQKNPSKTQLT